MIIFRWCALIWFCIWMMWEIFAVYRYHFDMPIRFWVVVGMIWIFMLTTGITLIFGL